MELEQLGQLLVLVTLVGDDDTGLQGGSTGRLAMGRPSSFDRAGLEWARVRRERSRILGAGQVAARLLWRLEFPRIDEALLHLWLLAVHHHNAQAALGRRRVYQSASRNFTKGQVRLELGPDQGHGRAWKSMKGQERVLKGMEGHGRGRYASNLVLVRGVKGMEGHGRGRYATNLVMAMGMEGHGRGRCASNWVLVTGISE